MEVRFKESILQNLSDYYYVININTCIIEDSNDPSASTEKSCHKLFHNSETPCFEHKKHCPLLFLKDKKKQIENGVYNDNGELTHVVSFKSDRDAFYTDCLDLNITNVDWKKLFDSFSSPAFILDNKQNILYANQATYDLDEAFTSKILNHKCYQVMHGTNSPPKDCPFTDCIDGACETHKKMLVENLGKFYNITCTPIFDKKGDIEKVIHIAQDVTDHELSRKKIVESELKYRQLFNNHISGFALHEIIVNEHNEPIDYKFLVCYNEFTINQIWLLPENNLVSVCLILIFELNLTLISFFSPFTGIS